MGYINSRSDFVRPVVTYEILNGLKYNPRDESHLLAVLTNRIALDPCRQTSEAIDLKTEAVHSHLRWITSFDQNYGFVQTTSVRASPRRDYGVDPDGVSRGGGQSLGGLD